MYINLYPGTYLQENKVPVYNYITILFKNYTRACLSPRKALRKVGLRIHLFHCWGIFCWLRSPLVPIKPKQCVNIYSQQMIMPNTPIMYAHSTVFPVCTLTRVTLPQHPCAYSVVW